MAKGIRGKAPAHDPCWTSKNHRQIDRYIARVSARWEMTGTSKDQRAAIVARAQSLDLVESELWSKLGTSKTRVFASRRLRPSWTYTIGG